MAKPGILQEADGAWSMRRTLALYYSILSGALLVIGALTGGMAGVYGGIGCALVVLVLLGLTTISDLRGVMGNTPQDTEQDAPQARE